jgi:pimeloyl-ACP methyl ester carboxylesterase
VIAPAAPSDAPSDAPAAVGEEVLDDLRERLGRARSIVLPEAGPTPGVGAADLDGLIRYWREGYDWRAHEQRIRALPWKLTTQEGIPARALHQLAGRPGAPTVVLLHGWPDSVLRFERLLPLLSDLNVVVPALPGFPFADQTRLLAAAAAEAADVVAGQLEALGHDRYVVSGGDIGRTVALVLAARHPDRVTAAHLTDLPALSLLGGPSDPPDDVETGYLTAVDRWSRQDGAYAHLQGTRPHTLAAALGDSPVGLLAWLLEKYRDWSDSDGEVSRFLNPDELLTWVTAYWVTGTIGTSFAPYVRPARPQPQVTAPVAFSVFPRDLVRPQRALVERYLDLRWWREEPSGGHFAAWERPEHYADGVRAAVALATAGV